jgi:LEA14-like dessication related protein
MSSLKCLRGFAIFGLSLMLGSCALFVPELIPPKVELESVAVEQMTLSQQLFRVRLHLTNPNNSALRVSEARLMVWLEAVEMGEGSILAPLSIPAMGEATVEVQFATDLVRRAPEIWRWFASGDTELNYRVTGFIDIGEAGMVKLNIDEAGRVTVSDLLRYTRLPDKKI